MPARQSKRSAPATDATDNPRVTTPQDSGFPVEEVALSSLHAHPRNYQRHPDDELAHIEQSLREHGLYRNVVIARDGTILAGHGVVEAARRIGLHRVLVIRLPYAPDDDRALKVLEDWQVTHSHE